jgi:transposase InsO family protein
LRHLHPTKEALVQHPNAPLTPLGRERLARCVVEDGWPLRRAAERFQVSVGTAKRWADRWREEGPDGMHDRSSRPHHSPRQTPTRRERRIIKVRLLRRWGPARIGFLLGIPASTVHRVLTRYRIARLAHLDRATGRVVRRYEHARPGDLVHVDIKKLGNIPDGGGHRVHGRVTGSHNSTHSAPITNNNPRAKLGYAYLHNAVDDHSRLAYTEILTDERKTTAAAFWIRAAAWFAAHGIDHIQRALTDNGPCYRSREFAEALHTTNTTHKRTRPYRPQTNGKVERFNRTLLEEWAYAQPYPNETTRRATLPNWLHYYNYHRGHTAIGGPPATRVPNLPGQYN